MGQTVREEEESEKLGSYNVGWMVNFDTVLPLQDGRECGRNENCERDIKEADGCPWKLTDEDHWDVG